MVVEEFLDGDELSVLALCDGERALPLAPARDFKRIGDGDTGPNTGGMGAYSPVAEIDDAFLERVRAEVHQPVARRAGAPRHAVPRRPLRRPDARPRTARRCSSSTSASAIPRRRRCCRGCAATCSTCWCARRGPGGLAGAALEWDARAAVTVVLASRGYPARSSSGDEITGLDGRPARTIEVTHAGTAERDGAIVTAGGRVLNVTALGDDVPLPPARPRMLPPT